MKRILLLICFYLVTSSIYLEASNNSQLDNETIIQKTEQKQSTNRSYFFKNEGEYPNQVEFYAKTRYGNLFINMDKELVYSIPKKIGNDFSHIAFKEILVNSKSSTLSGINEEHNKFNVFKPGMQSCDSKSNYGSVLINDIYSNIDLELKMHSDNIEKIFVVNPGAQPENIELKIEGIDNIYLKNDKLILTSALGELEFTAPIAYQNINGKTQFVDVKYVINDEFQYSFSTDEYNENFPLYIDPLLASTFVGGTSNDNGESLSFDNNGKLFMAGYTWSSNYPTSTGVFDQTYNGGNFDAFVSRFDTTLNTLEASTFIGGSDYDMGMSITIDTATGDVYFGGSVESTNFPVTAGCYQNTHGGDESDIFICRLSNDLSTLIASTYIGGNGKDNATRIIFDNISSKIFVTGYTKSTNFPTTLGAYDETFTGTGTLSSAFVSRLDNDLTTLEASTLIEGSNADEAHALQLDNSGNILVAGYTVSLDWPTTTGSYDQTHNSNKDAFLLRMDYDLTTLQNSTFIGGGYYDWATDIVEDGFNNIYMVGHTASDDYPTTSGAYSETFDNAVDIFVSKFSSDMSTLLKSTFIGGDSWDYSYDIELDSENNLFIAGNTYSTDYPTTFGAYDTTFNGAIDIFITKIDSDLSTVLASTFVGGSDFDYEEDIILDENNQVFFTGYTASDDYPTTSGVYNENFTGTSGSTRDAFISKFDKNLSTEPPIITVQPTDETVCENSNAEFNITATGGGTITYQWFQGTIGVYNPISGATNDTLSLPVNFSMNGDSIFCVATNEGGFANSDTVQLNIDLLVIANAGSDQSICEVNHTDMTATLPSSGSGLWSILSGSGTIVTPTNPISEVTGIGIGNNEFIWEITNGTCVSHDTVIIRQDVIIPAVAGSDINICEIDYTVMNADIPTSGTGTWIINDGGIVANPSDPISNITALPYGTNSFTWEITNGACVDNDDILITRDSLIIADAGTNQIFCEDDTTSLTGNVPEQGAGIWNVISGNAIFDNQTDPSTHISALNYGDNVLEWTITNGSCSSNDQVTIHRDSLIIADAGSDLSLCDTYFAVITADDPQPGNGLWSTFSGSGNFAQDNQFTTTVTNLAVNDNQLVWEVTNGVCVSTDTLIIHVDTTIQAQADLDQQICGDSTFLMAFDPENGVGIWSVYNGYGTINQMDTSSTYITDLASGSNIIHWTVTNGVCQSYDEIEIISDTIISANAGSDTTICDLTSIQLAANIGTSGIGTWFLISGSGSIVDINNPNTLVTNLGEGSNLFLWTVESGVCTDYDTVEVYRDVLVQATLETDYSVCGGNVTLTGNDPTTGISLWEVFAGDGSITSPTSSTTEVSGLSEGLNTFVYTITNGSCISSDTINITSDILIPADAGTDISICDTSAQLAANIGTSGIGTWFLISGNGSIVDINNPNSLVTNLNEGSNLFLWTVESGVCTDYDTVEVYRDVLVQATLETDYSVCGDNVTLTGNDPTTGISLWEVFAGDGSITSPTSSTTEVSGLSEGLNTFVYTITNGSCISSDTINITSDILMPADAGTDMSLCQTNTVTLTSSDNGNWELTAGTADVNNTSSLSGPIAIISEMGLGTNTFSYTVTNGNCIDTDYLNIIRDSLVIADAGIDQQICDDEYSTLVGNQLKIGSGVWTTLDSIPEIYSADQSVSNVDLLVPGDNTFIWTVTNGSCLSTDTMNIHRYESIFLLSQPQTKTIIQGDTICFIVEVEGDYSDFQWMFNGENISDTLQYSGATNDTLYINRASIDNSGTYTCLINGTCGDVYSNSAELFVDGGVAIFPNPTSGLLHINISRLEESYTVRVFDSAGRKIMEDNSTHNRLVLDMSKYRSGVYIVSVVFKNETINYKVVKD